MSVIVIKNGVVKLKIRDPIYFYVKMIKKIQLNYQNSNINTIHENTACIVTCDANREW